MDLAGKVALVTGGSGDIGGAIARRLGAVGAHVLVTYVGAADAAAATVSDIEQGGGSASALQLDQRSPQAIEACIEHIADTNGRLDILVNNAAWNIGIPFADLDALTPEIWDRVMETNLRAPFLLARAAASLLMADGGGHIVNISSAGGISPGSSSIAYSSSKAGLNHLTRCLAVAMAPHVAVNCIAPGLVENTRMAKRLPDAVANGARQQAVLGRVGQADDIAAVDGHLRLVPTEDALQELETDYGRMIEDGLLLDDADSFEAIVGACGDLERRANNEPLVPRLLRYANTPLQPTRTPRHLALLRGATSQRQIRCRSFGV